MVLQLCWCTSRFYCQSEEDNQQTLTLHCLLHREDLHTKRLFPEFHNVTKEVIQVVHFIKPRSLNCRICNQICCDFGLEHIHLLYHSRLGGHHDERKVWYRMDFFLFNGKVVATRAANQAPPRHISAAVAIGNNILPPRIMAFVC